LTSTIPDIRVLLIHDRQLVREGLRALIEQEPGITVVNSTASFHDAISITARETPDLLLIDVDRSGEEDGLQMLGALLQNVNGTPTIILADLSENIDDVRTQAATLGASGLVLKQEGPNVLNKAIRKVHEGEVWFDRASMGRILRERIDSSGAKTESAKLKASLLTAREREVVGLVAEGLKNKQIAERLFISESTVTHHLSSIFSKLDVSDRLELLIYAFSHNLAKVVK
jgi:DNA-binding NarL/FixJ family response regulator